MTEVNASPEQIEQQISETRAEIDQTLVALQNKLSPGQLLDQALGYAKDGGGAFAANLGRAVRDNPVPITLLGVGLGWLMISGRSAPEPEWSGRRRDHDIYGDVSDMPGSVEPQYQSPARPRHSVGDAPGIPPGFTGVRDAPRQESESHRAKHEAHPNAGKTRSKGDEAESKGGSVKDRASKIADDARERVESAGERIGQMGDEVADRVGAARAKASEYAEQSRQGLARARVSAERYYHDNPLVIGAAAFAVGAALGALLPATRREDELMGEHSDAAKAAAEEAVAEGAEKAKTMAAAAVKGAKERVGQEAQARSGDQPGGGADERSDQGARGAAPLAPEKASADDRSMPPAGRRATPQSETNQPHQQPTRKKGVGSG